MFVKEDQLALQQFGLDELETQNFKKCCKKETVQLAGPSLGGSSLANKQATPRTMDAQ